MKTPTRMLFLGMMPHVLDLRTWPAAEHTAPAVSLSATPPVPFRDNEKIRAAMEKRARRARRGW